MHPSRFSCARHLARPLHVVILGGILSWLVAMQAVAQPDAFPRPPALKGDVAFWVRVYSELETSEGVLHDARSLSMIYERLKDLPPEFSDARRELIDQRIAGYRERLQFLAGGAKARDAEDERVLALWTGAMARSVPSTYDTLKRHGAAIGVSS